jgi:hypothetical protein
MNREVVCKLRPSVRRANRNAIRAAGACDDRPEDTALPQAPTGPRAAVRDRKQPAAADHGPAAIRGAHMATITKLYNKVQHGSALNGWRMRWHMQ